jgi:hypothetical protein
MPDYSDRDIATADALTLLLNNQHVLGAAIEEITKWLSEMGLAVSPLMQCPPWKRWTQMLKPSQIPLCGDASYRMLSELPLIELPLTL